MGGREGGGEGSQMKKGGPKINGEEEPHPLLLIRGIKN